MSTSVFHRRRAERLAQLLDEASGSPRRRSHSTLDGELAGYVRLGDLLRGTSSLLPEPDPEFRTGLRAMLVATAEREGIGRESDPDPTEAPAPRAPLVGSRRAKGAVLVGLAAGTLALSGVSAASENALPGDPLYGVKRSAENVQLALAGSDMSKGDLYLGFARDRLAEARNAGSLRDQQFDDMDSETRDGARLLLRAAVHRHESASLDAIDGFVAAQRADLARFGDDERVRQSVALLDRIAARSDTVRANLGCTAATGGSDDLGPLAQTCPPAAVPGPGHTGGRGSGSGPRPDNTSGATAPGTDAGTADPSPTPATPSPSPSDLIGHLLHGII